MYPRACLPGTSFCHGTKPDLAVGDLGAGLTRWDGCWRNKFEESRRG